MLYLSCLVSLTTPPSNSLSFFCFFFNFRPWEVRKEEDQTLPFLTLWNFYLRGKGWEEAQGWELQPWGSWSQSPLVRASYLSNHLVHTWYTRASRRHVQVPKFPNRRCQSLSFVHRFLVQFITMGSCLGFEFYRFCQDSVNINGGARRVVDCHKLLRRLLIVFESSCFRFMWVLYTFEDAYSWLESPMIMISQMGELITPKWSPK